MNEEDLFMKITAIKRLHESGLDRFRFFAVLNNAHNRSSQAFKNKFTVTEWIDHYNTDGIIINSEQINLFFEYLRRFYPSLISKIDNKYLLLKSPNEEDYGLELIVLQTLAD
ncbi:hypothetical protein [Chryseobacterium ginsenosidimutans]|uniref:hypothetical protein n=1 Tax=Chryseobacterium ginsenosidimutans TaxID=687846 RepID=UPI0027BA5C24|nr:hypothetical protein [Chryseobacterium ginsenosidimutans]